MKKTILLTGALIGMTTSVLQAVPSWLKILTLKTKIYHAQLDSNDLKNMFEYKNNQTPSINFKKLLSNGSSQSTDARQLKEAQKVAKQLRVINGMITWASINNNFRSTRAFFSPFLKVLPPCSVGGAIIGEQFSKNHYHTTHIKDRSVDGFLLGSLAGCLLAMRRHLNFDLYPDKEYTQYKLDLYRKISAGIKSSLTNELPHYLEQQGLPEKVVQSTMNTLNKPTATQLIKQTFLRALKR